jgi:hypothetical protein
MAEKQMDNQKPSFLVHAGFTRDHIGQASPGKTMDACRNAHPLQVQLDHKRKEVVELESLCPLWEKQGSKNDSYKATGTSPLQSLGRCVVVRDE